LELDRIGFDVGRESVPLLQATRSKEALDISFATQLEKAIKRSQAPYVPKPALLAPEQHSPEELKKPFTMRRRNLR
jgi:hypothetical protein